MMSQPIQSKFTIGNTEVSIETGKLARQADGAVTVRCGNCILLATVCANKEPKEGQSFFPLSVDYQEKFGSAGRIPGSFFKREARLNDYEILTSRLIDRALRPLFPEDYFCDVQVLVTLVSSDAEIMPDSLACLAASAALTVSDIPIMEIISEVRVSKIDGQIVINPTRSQLKKADYEFIIAATEKNIMMVEGEAKECSEEDLIQAIEAGHAAIKEQVKAQEKLKADAGANTKREYTKPYRNEELYEKVKEFAQTKMYEIAKSASSKHDRSSAFRTLAGEVVENFKDLEEKDAKLLGFYYGELQYHVVRDMILNDRVRLDGRQLDEVRGLAMEVEALPSPHGSSLFTRGETQSLTTVTLGTPLDEILVESAQESHYSKFYLHYNFPPFSTGEVKMLRGQSRREVGHGNLALRSLRQLMPGEDFAYTVRVVSDILESNGSSSMATVCAGSLALMDCGIPIPKHMSGVAMGLISKEGRFAVLTDILGDEDHLGDMDFKVTGTRDGICGVQMDIKVDGLSMDVMRAALEQARRGRLHILDAMYECIPAHRPDYKPHAPRMTKIFIDKEFIGAVIGPGGKIIQEMQKVTGTTINLEEKNERGEVSIFGTSKEAVDKALAMIRNIVAMPEVDETYEGAVKSIMPFGAFVEFMPGKQGLMHISEVSWKRLETLEGILKEGDVIKVKMIGIDQKTGKYKLSRKALLPRPEGMTDRPPQDRDGGRDGGGNQGGGGFRREGGSGFRDRDGGGGGYRGGQQNRDNNQNRDGGSQNRYNGPRTESGGNPTNNQSGSEPQE